MITNRKARVTLVVANLLFGMWVMAPKANAPAAQQTPPPTKIAEVAR